MNITPGIEHKRNLTPPSPPLKLRGGWGALSHLSKEGLLSKKGSSLVELLITLTIFSVIGTMMYSTYSTFLKQVTVERKKTKTELDIFNVSWPLIKEIETAGFGVPKTGTCGSAISLSGNDLTIHSTAAGDSEYAGAWSYVIDTTTRGAVFSVAGTTTIRPGLPTDENVVIINSLDKSRLGLDSVSTTQTAVGSGYYFLTDTTTNAYENNIAYWTPYESSPDIECYEAIYSLTAYDSGTRPGMCEASTQRLTRSSRPRANDPFRRTMLDCVLTLAYRFGCIDASGNLTWKTNPTSCGTAKLRLMKIGMIIQASSKGGASPANITLFEDLGSGFVVDTSISPEQRNYKWRKLEQTITLKNLE